MSNQGLTRRIQELPDFLSELAQREDVAAVLARVDAARDGFVCLEPFDGVELSALDDYRHEWMGRYVYNSNAIEGSTLTLEDTELVLEGEFIPSDSPARYIFAARGVADGMAYVEQYVSEHRLLSVDLVQKLHEVTALDVQPVLRGRFRPYGYTARITATRVKTADPLEIYEDMEALIDGVNKSPSHPLLKAAGFHVMFENIHPFADGNGRTGRQVMNLMLMQAGYRPVAVKYDAGRSYGRSLEAWQVNSDPMPWVDLVTGLVEQEERTAANLVETLRTQSHIPGSANDLGFDATSSTGRVR